ncbi:MAG: hypothetical protein KDD33_06425 [Bdellovibrionales bacterium]|nr:hypothetical protein [Bdellovibrionales bacterium]
MPKSFFVVLFASFVSLSTAFASGFDLVESKDNQICKVQDKKVVSCLPKATYYGSEGENTQLVPSLDVLASAKRVIAIQDKTSKEELTLEDMLGGIFSSSLLGPEKLAYIVANYRELSIRNIAAPQISGDEIPAEYLDLENKKIEIPIFFSLRWKGHKLMEGTLNVEAVLVLDLVSEDDANNEEGGADILSVFANPKVKEFSDSSTEAKIEALRKLETAARYIHFKSVAGKGTSEEKTQFLLEEVAAPMVTHEVYTTPIYKSFLTAIGEVIVEIFKGIAIGGQGQ